MKHDLKKEKQPSGKYVYIFSEKDELGDTYYRIGLTKNLKKRIPNHGTSNVHKKKYIFKIKSLNIYHLENCIKSMLYDHRYKANKDYYKVSVNLIKKAIKICEKCIIKFKCYDCNEKIKQTNNEFSNHFNNYHINKKISEYNILNE